MRGHQLPLEIVCQALDDARDAGVNKVRFYGGEPLLHRDLARMVEHSVKNGFDTYVNTNGTLLQHKIGELYSAGLRQFTIGFYGVGDRHSLYTQRGNSFHRLEAGIQAVRDRCGDEVELQLNFVVTGQTCNAPAARAAWGFAHRHNMFFHVDLVNPLIPFFAPSRHADLAINEDHRPAVIEMTEALLTFKRENPDRFLHSFEFLRSIPDWLLDATNMRVPCDAYQTLWIGADGTVQLCDTALKIGNVKEKRLRELVFTDVHKQAARDAFCLNCPQCLCKIETRIVKDARSVRRYRSELPPQAAATSVASPFLGAP